MQETTKRLIIWIPIAVGIISLVLLLMNFLDYGNIHDIFPKPKVSLNVDNQSVIICEHNVPELNSSNWEIMKEDLPTEFNLSLYPNYTIDPILYYPWGFILTITREGNIDIVNPALIISYDKANFFYDASLSSGLIMPESDPKPKIFTGESNPIYYNASGTLSYHLDSPYMTTVYLPDLTRDNPKLIISVRFLVDLNHDCRKDFPIKFMVKEEIHKIKTDEKISILRVVE